MGAREDVLSRIRSALSDVPSGEPAEGRGIPRNYRRHRNQPEGALERFCERVADYKATIQQVYPDEVAAAVHEALRRAGATRVGVPEGLPSAWTVAAQEITLIRDTTARPLSTAELDALDAVVTGSVVGIAETGTIVLESGALCGRRALTLVPDVHVCIVRAEDVVDDLPAAVSRLDPARPLTWISGPSATSDIELRPGRGSARTAHPARARVDRRKPAKGSVNVQNSKGLSGYKATIAVAMSNYIQAGSIIALATNLTLWQEAFGLSDERASPSTPVAVSPSLESPRSGLY